MAKVRISVTLDEKLLKELDIFREKNFSVARSTIIEKATAEFLKKQSQKDTGE